MEKEEVKKEIHGYGETHLSQVQNNFSNSKVVISADTKTKDNFYQDQIQKVQFKIGLKSGTVEEAGSVEVVSAIRDIINVKLQEYLSKFFKPEVTKSNVYFDSEKNRVVILISAHNINLKNFWSGEWLSSWFFDLSTKKMTGKIKADTYYYEEGNVQFILNQDYEDDVTGDDDTQIADCIINLIQEHENTVQTDLDKVYDEFNEFYIKPLRRNLPITGTKMNWSLNQVHFTDN